MNASHLLQQSRYWFLLLVIAAWLSIPPALSLASQSSAEAANVPAVAGGPGEGFGFRG